MDSSERIKFQDQWLKSAQEDLETAQELFGLKRFSACLFFCHLAVEKVLKALCIKTNDTSPPPIHNLVKLAADAKIEVDTVQEGDLKEITTFNVEARYDIHKLRLYKKATESFTQKYLQITQELFNFFKQQL